MSKARELAELGAVYDSGALSNRNFIINGGFQVAQRGTSGTFTYGAYVLDRWRGYSAAAVTMSQQSFSAGQTDVTGYPKYYARFVPSSAVYNFGQRVEDITLFGDQTLTLSFWMKCSSSKTTDVRYTKSYGSGGSSAETIAINTSVNLTTSWQKFTETFTVTTNSGKTIGAGSYLQITFGDSTAFTSSETVEIANVQLELGPEATPFEHRSYGDELARCQRYYYRTQSTRGNGYGAIFTGVIYSTGTLYGSFNLPQEMRASPTTGNSGATGWRLLGNTAPNCDPPYVGDSTPREVLLGVTSTGQTGGTSWSLTPTSTNSWLAFDAEL